MSSGGATYEELFTVMARASVGYSDARVEIPPDANLEDPVTRLGVALNVLLDDLEYRHRQAESNLRLLVEERTEAIRRREELISIAAHEIYTPLTSLQLVLQGLRKGIVADDPQLLHRVVTLAERQSRKLAGLVEVLLSVGRSQSNTPMILKREQVDLVALASGVVELFAPDLQRSASKMIVDLSMPVVGNWDRHRIEQVLTNLIGNAIKFGEGKPIQLTISSHAGMARVVVADEGIGIAPERLPRIFERFERAVSASNYGGLGLGLSIVREIVRAHGGSVLVESAPGEGSTFVVELPCEVNATR